ncbi:hypothetical protein RCO48_39495 [Peribacillus frigoritolerans]|nr:hypothetical protein [Peribacillus frigoritolerans]
MNLKPKNLIKHVGPPFQETLKNFYGMQPADVDKAVGFFRQRFKEKGMFENELYPRIPPLLEKAETGRQNISCSDFQIDSIC